MQPTICQDFQQDTMTHHPNEQYDMVSAIKPMTIMKCIILHHPRLHIYTLLLPCASESITPKLHTPPPRRHSAKNFIIWLHHIGMAFVYTSTCISKRRTTHILINNTPSRETQHASSASPLPTHHSHITQHILQTK